MEPTIKPVIGLQENCLDKVEELGEPMHMARTEDGRQFCRLGNHLTAKDIVKAGHPKGGCGYMNHEELVCVPPGPNNPTKSHSYCASCTYSPKE